MNDFYVKIKEAFQQYECRMYDQLEITFTPRPFLQYGVPTIVQFNIENFIEQLDDFFKVNACPYEYVSLKFLILMTNRFKEYNPYGHLITRAGIDDVAIEKIVIKNFNKNELIDIVMKDVNREHFVHISDISAKFR